MVLAYTTRTVKDMDDNTRNLIISAGIPLEIYTTGLIHLGPNNKQALERFANIVTKITYNQLPLPPDRFVEFVVDTTSGTVTKADYRMTLDALPSYGKSYTSIEKAARYAMDLAERWGQDPKDYFTLTNCALLQDTEGVTALMDSLGKYQAVVIDDAGVSAGNRNWNSPENKAIGAIMQTCRTKRWFLTWNMPNRKFVDNQIRDLVYAKAQIYKPCHAAQFNILKINSVKTNPDDPMQKEYRHRFSFDGRKVNFHASFSPELLDPYKGLIEKYDAGRDLAGDALIHDRAIRQKQLKIDRKPSAEKKREEWQEKVSKHYKYVVQQVKAAEQEGREVNRTKIREYTGLTDRNVIDMIALYRTGGR